MAFPETVILPEGRLGHTTQMVGLLDRAEGRMRRQFLRLVRDTNALMELEAVAALLEAGDIQGALALSDQIAPNLVTTLDQVYMAAGLSSAEFLRSRVDTLLDFNAANARAVFDLQQTRLRLVREFGDHQRRSTQLFLEDAFRRGLAPIEQARELKRSIGLTQHQAQSVVNYRRLLERRSPAALERRLRDRRFDSTLLSAIRNDRPLTTAQIDRQVERYRERWIQHRAQTIARTESLGAASAADEELFRQAIESGTIQADDLVNTWRTSRRSNVRDSHRAMEGQVRPIGEAFRSGAGNALRFPGDPLAPAEDRINCNCVLARDIKRSAASQVPTATIRAA